MSKIEEILLSRPIQWLHLEYNCENGHTYIPYNLSGTIVRINGDDAIIRLEDNTYRSLDLYEVRRALDKEPDGLQIWYAISRHQGAIRREMRLADQTPHDIYTLIDPRDAIIRYVGMSKQVGMRYDQHIHCSGSNEYKNAWIRNLLEHNLLPELGIIEHVNGRYYARRREEYWINRFLEMGLPLTNVGEWIETKESSYE